MWRGCRNCFSVEEVSRLTEYMIHNVPGKDELRRACDYAAAIAEAGSDVRALLEDGAPEDIQKYRGGARKKGREQWQCLMQRIKKQY